MLCKGKTLFSIPLFDLLLGSLILLHVLVHYSFISLPYGEEDQYPSSQTVYKARLKLSSGILGVFCQLHLPKMYK